MPILDTNFDIGNIIGTNIGSNIGFKHEMKSVKKQDISYIMSYI